MKRNWKLIFLPFLFRECPMGNAHWRGNHICYCCEGEKRNWTYVWRGEKGWVPLEFALNTESQHNSLSWSGQLTTLDLIWNGVRTGLLIAVLIIIVFGSMLYFMWDSGKNYQKNVQKKHELITNSNEKD